MVYLVTRANFVVCLLFHVEHFDGEEWFCRWRIRGEYPLPYLEWRELAAREARVLIQPEITACEVEVEWRAEKGEPWRQAALREIVPVSVAFRVKARVDFASGAEGFEAVAPLPGGMVAQFKFAPLDLAAGVETVITGTAVGAFPDNVLLAAGEFFSIDPRLELENLAPTTECFMACDGPAVLSRIEGCHARRVFAHTGRNHAAEILSSTPAAS
jgi:hypothetical protein